MTEPRTRGQEIAVAVEVLIRAVLDDDDHGVAVARDTLAALIDGRQ